MGSTKGLMLGLMLGVGFVLADVSLVSAQSLYHPLGGSSSSGARVSLLSGRYPSAKSGDSSSRTFSTSSFASSIATQGLQKAGEKMLEGAQEEFSEEYPKVNYVTCGLKAVGHCSASILNGELDRFVAAGQQKSAGYLSSVREEAVFDCMVEIAACRRSYVQDIMKYCKEAPRAANLYYECDIIKAKWECELEENKVPRFTDPNRKTTCLERQAVRESMSSLFKADK